MTRVLAGTNVRYANQQIARQEPVSVVLRGTTTPATLYTDALGSTVMPNPVTTDDVGNIAFYIDPGSYDYMAFGARIAFDVLNPAAQVGHPHHQIVQASVWMVSHGLGIPRMPVILLDDEPDRPVYTDVEFPDVNTAVLTFPTPVTGWAHF